MSYTVPIEGGEQVPRVLNQVWAGANDLPQYGTSIGAANRMIFVNRQEFPPDGEAAKIVNLSCGTFLKQRTFPVEAILVNVKPKLRLVEGVEDLRLELRGAKLNGIAGSFYHDGKTQRLNHLRYLPPILEQELAWTRDSKLPGQFEIIPFVQHTPKRLRAGHGQPRMLLQIVTMPLEQHQRFIRHGYGQADFMLLD